MGRVSVPDLRSLCVDILAFHNVPLDDAAIIADSVIYAHVREKHTHGIGRMGIYVRKIKQGLLNHFTPIVIESKTPIVTLIDAKNGFGQVAAVKAMRLAVEKAATYGIGLVGVKDSNNFGTAGFISEQATKDSMIGIVFSNSAPAIAPTGGNKAVFGTNPICIAFPSVENGYPIVFDMACSGVARGKVRLAAKRGERIPIGWAVDENGEDTDDPEEALKGFMLPVGGYKGYGLALCVDILAGLMTGSGFGGDVRNLDHPTDMSRQGHMVMVINPVFFMGRAEYFQRMSKLIYNIKASGNMGNVYIPGEKSFEKSVSNDTTVSLKQDLIDEINALADEAGAARITANN